MRPAFGVISLDRCPVRKGRAITCIGFGTQVRGSIDLWTRAYGPGLPPIASRARTPVPGPVRQCRNINYLRIIFKVLIAGFFIKSNNNITGLFYSNNSSYNFFKVNKNFNNALFILFVRFLRFGN